MPEQNLQEKTEPATPRKREQSRKKGDVAKSKELGMIAVLSAGVLFLYFNVQGMVMDLGSLIEHTFLYIPDIKTHDHNVLDYLNKNAWNFLKFLMPMMIVLCVVAILVNYVQSGFIWSVEPLAPKASKIDPLQGTKRMFSKRSLVELAKSMAKVTIVGWAAYSTLREEFHNLIPLMYQEKGQIVAMLGQASLKVVIRSFMVIIILAILDFIYQKWEHEDKLKMTKQEVKDEFKQTEGDPQVKSRIKSIQREMARRRMMEEVPKADVVITNPVHLAVALRYDHAGMRAPSVVAKGANKIAFKIREVAETNAVPVIENRILAQNLYKLDLGEEIPIEFYKAVAEILAYVYSLKNKEARV